MTPGELLDLRRRVENIERHLSAREAVPVTLDTHSAFAAPFVKRIAELEAFLASTTTQRDDALGQRYRLDAEVTRLTKELATTVRLKEQLHAARSTAGQLKRTLAKVQARYDDASKSLSEAMSNPIFED